MTTSSTQKTIRFENIDLLKGITILLVVLYHLTFFYKGSQFIRIYATPFFMQLFFFISGMFFAQKSNFKVFFINKVNRIVIPLLFFYSLNYFAGFLVSLVMPKSSASSVDAFSLINLLDLFNGKEYFTYSGALWFLFCLLNVSFIYYIISKIKNENFKLIIVLLFSCLGYYLGSNNINLPYFLDSSFTVLPYFYLGNILRKQNFFIEKQKNDVYVFVALFLIYFTVIFCFDFDIKIMKNSFRGNVLLITIASLLGIYLHFILCKLLQKIKIINFFGENSLIILGTHQLLIVFFSIILKKFFNYDDRVLLFINFSLVMFSEIFIILFCNRYLARLVGKEKLL